MTQDAATEKYFDDVPKQPVVFRLIASLLSYVFHPLFIAPMVTAVLLWLQPLNHLLIDDIYKPRMLAMVILYTALFPAFAVFLLWRLKFIQSIHMHTQKERIIPFVISMFFFFWIYYVSRNLEYFPLALKQFLMGVFLSSASALFANIFTKISMHGMAMGGMVAFAFIQQCRDMYWQPGWSLIALLAGGLVCTARLILKAHRPVDIYAGYGTGVICQLLSAVML